MFVILEAGPGDRSRTGETCAAEIVVLVLDLRRPVRVEHVFNTGAEGIAVAMVAVSRERHRRTTDADAVIGAIAPGVTALGVKQGRPQRIAEPTGRRAKLIGVAAHERTARQHHTRVAISGEPAVLGFSADHPVVRELIVEAALHTAEETAIAALQ